MVKRSTDNIYDVTHHQDFRRHDSSDRLHSDASPVGLPNLVPVDNGNLEQAATAEEICGRQVLEQLLTPIGENAKNLTQDIIDEFGTLGAALHAPREAIERVADGLTCDVLTSIKEAISHCLRERFWTRPVSPSDEDLKNYLIATMADSQREQFRILFLDRGNHLLRDEVESERSLNEQYSSPRGIIARALQLEAAAIIIAHNRPGEDPEPDRADILFTARLARVSKDLDIEFQDHLIIGGDQCFSMKDAGALEIEDMTEMLDEELEQALDVIVASLQPVRFTKGTSNESDMVASAKEIYRSRRARDRFFSDLIDLGEPSWDLLVDLYIADEESKSISISSACVAASVPTTTAMRCIERLEQKGVVSREPDPEDGRRSNLVLSQQAKIAMERYLASNNLH